MKLLFPVRNVHVVITVAVVLSAQLLQAQPSVQWQQSLGGSALDRSASIAQLTNGGYIVAGESLSVDGNVTGHHDSLDCWIVNLSSNGFLQWQKSLGGSGTDRGNSIRQTTDSGYILAGFSTSNDGDVSGNHGYTDAWIVKMDPVGALQWQKSLGGSGYEVAYDIQQTSDGGYITVGSSSSTDGDVTGNHGSFDIWVVKLDAAGVLQWQKSLGGTSNEDGYSIEQTADGGYCLAGRSSSLNGDLTMNHGLQDLWFIKLDSTGILQWQKSFGGSDDDFGLSGQQTSDGGYIIAGSTRSADGDVTGNHGLDDMWIVRLDSTGNLQWQKTLGGTGFEKAFSIRQIPNGGFIVAGMATSNDNDVSGHHGGFQDVWVVNLSSGGILQWQKALGGSGSEEAYSIRQTTDGGYVTAGFSNSGDGDVSGNNGGYDYWIVKLDSTVDVEALASSQPFSVFPNPVENELRIQTLVSGYADLEIHTAYGAILFSHAQQVNNGKELVVHIPELASGIYLLKLRIGKRIWINKFVKE